MDSSEEISDNILSYLLDNVRDCDSSFLTEGENVSTVTDNEFNHGSELDNSLNPFNLHSAKKLEWDSSADVGCLPHRTPDFNSKLSTLERMALSNSASKLCVDEDERSLALIARIDKALAKSRQPSRTLERLSKKPPRLPSWAAVDSGSNASLDTVIPNTIETAQLKPVSKLIESHSQDYCGRGGIEEEFKPQSNKYKDDLSCFVNHSQCNQRMSPSSEKPSDRVKRSQLREASCEMFITRSVASEDGCSVMGSNVEHSASITSPNTAGQEKVAKECRCMSADLSEATQCPTHTSLSTEHTRRLHREAIGELQVYRGLKDHLKSLRDYVAQLEQTWKFLDQTKTATYSKRGNISSTRHSRQTEERVPSVLDDTSAASICTRTSEILSSPIETPVSLKSERSFELERLNLRDTDSTETPSTQHSKPIRRSKSDKCCAHCSLRKPKPVSQQTLPKKPTKSDTSVQTSNRRSYRRSEDKPNPNQIPAQREPVAFEISLDHGRQRNRSERPSSKTSLQDALKEKRPDFCQESARRQQALQEIAHLRRTGAIDCNSIPRLFTYNQLRKQTEQVYRQLPEVRYKNRDQVRKEVVNSNRIKASVYQRKLQSRVLKGQINLPHSTCL